VPGVTEQRLPVSECAHHHIPARHLRHAAAREFERVVGRLVVEDLDDEDDAFLAGNIGRRQAHVMTQATRLRDRGDLVDDDGLHLLHASTPRACRGGQGRPARV
jgi:hypothetical protein